MWGLPAYFCQRVLGNCSISWKRAAGSPSNAAQCRGVRPTGLRSGSFMSFSSLLSLSRAVLQFLRPPLARHRPSLAKSQRACRQSLAWGKRGRAKLARIYHRPHQQQLSSQNYRSCSGPPWTLRLSQFCVQGNRVRLMILLKQSGRTLSQNDTREVQSASWIR